MTQVLVPYRAKPEHIAGNDQVVRAVHDELQRTESSGFQNATLQAGDGVTQVHGLYRQRQRANTADKAGRVRRFQDTNGDRCDEPGLSPSCARSAPRRHREEARQPPAGQARRRQPQRSRRLGASSA